LHDFVIAPISCPGKKLGIAFTARQYDKWRTVTLILEFFVPLVLHLSLACAPRLSNAVVAVLGFYGPFSAVAEELRRV
jgi:hypothetical protein